MSDFETHPVGTAARIAQLEAVVKAGDVLAALVADNVIDTHDWLDIRAALTTYRAAKGAKP